MVNRFKSLLEQLNLSPSEFADRIGIQRSSVSHVISGRNKPSIDFLEKILNVFPEIDTTWLITGRISVQKDLSQVNSDVVNDRIRLRNAPEVNAEKNKSSAPANEEPVDHIIIVYKNNTFRILKSSEK